MSEFNPGDIVRLKSGGPPMTVTNFDHDAVCANNAVYAVDCEWFAGDNLKRDSFLSICLIKDRHYTFGEVRVGACMQLFNKE